MKRIAILVPNLNGGGAERVALNIANILSRTGHNVHMVLAQKSGVYFEQLEKRVTLHVCNYSKTMYSIFGIGKIVRRIEPEVVLSTTHRMNVIASIVWKFWKGNYRLILRLPNSPQAEIDNDVMSPWRLKLYSKAYRNCSFVLAQSDAMKQEAQDVFHLDDDRVRVLINPLDLLTIENSLEQMKNPFNSLRTNILAVGRIHEAKGFDFLIEAFVVVVQKNPDYFLNIIGNDNGQQDILETLVKDRKIEQNVRFWGHQNNPYPFYKYCDAYVLSSRWEGLPNALLENLYLGKPAIATRCVPIINTLITEGKNGYTVEFGDRDDLATKILSYSKLVPKKYVIDESDIESVLFD